MSTGKIAIPYYGSLSHPNSGFERVFFILEQDATPHGSYRQLGMGIWDAGETPLLSAWLRQIGVNQLVCKNVPDRSLSESMLKSGIRIFDAGSDKAKRILKTLCLI